MADTIVAMYSIMLKITTVKRYAKYREEKGVTPKIIIFTVHQKRMQLVQKSGIWEINA
jgi:hypothetical protein